MVEHTSPIACKALGAFRCAAGSEICAQMTLLTVEAGPWDTCGGHRLAPACRGCLYCTGQQRSGAAGNAATAAIGWDLIGLDATALQKSAELVFNKPRQQNDPTKLDEFVSAQIELNCAAKVFKQLQQVSSLHYYHHAGGAEGCMTACAAVRLLAACLQLLVCCAAQPQPAKPPSSSAAAA